MNDILKPILVLGLICVISSALLGATYSVTKDPIAQAEIKATNEAMQEVLPKADSFTELSEGPAAALIEQTKESKIGLLMAARADNGEGYVFKVQDKGFGGKYVVMVGVGPDGKITGAKLMDNSETPGLGSKTGEEKFTGRFTGLSAGEVDGVERIVGASISSNAFKRAVLSACEAYDAVKGGE